MKADYSVDEAVRRLAAAILIRAIEDLRGQSRLKKEDALAWMRSSDEMQFSFVFCCRALGRDPERVRPILEQQYSAALKSSELPQPAPALRKPPQSDILAATAQKRTIDWARLRLISQQL
jgi:hypothetical protein